MTTLEEVEQLLASLNRAEKAQVLQWVVRDLGDFTAFLYCASSPTAQR